MKLTYKILWLDDLIQDFIDGEVIEEVELHIKNLGFNSEIITVSQTTDFFNKLSNDFDLILTDYHLNDMNGDKVIERIRGTEFSVMTEILFYTAQADLSDAEKISRVSFLETSKKAGSSHEDKIIAEVKSLIDLTVKKFQHIVAMRGMIMNETSSLDIDIQKLLLKIIDLKGAKNVIPTIKSKYIASNSKFNEAMEGIDDIEPILLKIGATHRWRAVIRNLEKGDNKTIFNDYEKEIISIRNKFAHAILLKDDKTGQEYFQHGEGESGIIFNEDLCKEIRTNIIKHRKNFNETSEKIKDNKRVT